MFLTVKNYESYINFYPGTDIPKEVFESGKTFEIQDEFFDIRQKNKVIVVEAPQKEIKIEEQNKEEKIVSPEVVLPIEEDEKKSARKRALEKLKGNPSSGLHTNSPGPI